MLMLNFKQELAAVFQNFLYFSDLNDFFYFLVILYNIKIRNINLIKGICVQHIKDSVTQKLKLKLIV